MTNWLGKATAVLAKETPEPASPFVIVCECRQEHEGLRKSRSQRIICQSCGTALFVLPKDVYPPPVPRRKKKRRGSETGPPGGPSLPPFSKVAGHAWQQSAKVATKVGGSLQAGAVAARESLVTKTTQAILAVRSALTPFRVVLGAIILAAMATAGWSLHTHSLERASQAFRTESELGQTALAGEELSAAREHFERAVAAADRLELQDSQVQLIRQLARETTALTRLSPESLVELVFEAEQVAGSRRPNDWPSTFRAKYLGTWLILDAQVRRSGIESSSYVVEFPLLVGDDGRSVEVRADLPVFDSLFGSEDAPRIIFAAQLEDCVLQEPENRWLVTLRAESGFLWTNLDNLKLAGLLTTDGESEEQTRALLVEQAKIVGIESVVSGES